MQKNFDLPLIPLRGLTVFPNTTVNFDVGRKKSVAAVTDAVKNRNGKIIIPRGHDSIKYGDTVIVVTTNTGFKDISDILE